MNTKSILCKIGNNFIFNRLQLKFKYQYDLIEFQIDYAFIRFKLLIIKAIYILFVQQYVH